jgi:hypothetical protein
VWQALLDFNETAAQFRPMLQGGRVVILGLLAVPTRLRVEREVVLGLQIGAVCRGGERLKFGV